MLECWQNQQDSTHKQQQQQPFWEPLPVPFEVSNENNEIVDRMELRQHEAIANCLDGNGKEGKLHFVELEAIYKRLGDSESNGKPVNAQLPNYGSDISMGEEEEDSPSLEKNGRKKKQGSCSRMISPMTKFFENMVK